MRVSAPLSYRPRSGLVTFAGVMFVIVGLFNLADGAVALWVDSEKRPYEDGDWVIFNLKIWGGMWLGFGVLQFFAGWWILLDRPFGLLLGATLAGANMLAQLLFLPAYPVWAVAIMVLDAVVIWSLCAAADAFE